MAYVISKIGESPNIQYKQYVCSSQADLAAIHNPISGSIAYVLENNKLKQYFFINNSWTEMSNSGNVITLNDLPLEVTTMVSSASTLGYYPIVNIDASDCDEVSEGNNPQGISLYSNKQYIIGSASDPVNSIYISTLVNSLDEDRFSNEFYFEFYTNDGSEASTSLILEESLGIQWIDELTIEDNKHYQISILNDVALWCVTDIPTSTQGAQS